VPSVTTITGILDKAGLLQYFHKQVIAAVFSETRQKEHESWDLYVQRIIFASKQESKKASERGSDLHNKLEDYFKVYKVQEEEFLLPVIQEVLKLGKNTDFIPEQAFSSPLGFGGKVDLINIQDDLIIDFKTKTATDKKKFYKYDEHLMQLAAYREGLNMPTARCFDLYFSSAEPGIVEMHEWSEKELQKGLLMFKSLLSYWKVANDYDSSFEVQKELSK
jgi:hypothetical protein